MSLPQAAWKASSFSQIPRLIADRCQPDARHHATARKQAGLAGDGRARQARAAVGPRGTELRAACLAVRSEAQQAARGEPIPARGQGSFLLPGGSHLDEIGGRKDDFHQNFIQ
jgi:hypothetical protein